MSVCVNVAQFSWARVADRDALTLRKGVIGHSGSCDKSINILCSLLMTRDECAVVVYRMLDCVTYVFCISSICIHCIRIGW